MSEGIYKYGKDIVWSLPCLFQYEIVYGAIYDSLSNIGIKLPKVNLFGAPWTMWTGETAPTIYGEFDKTSLNKVLNYVYNCNACPTFTFCAQDIKKEDLEHKYSNMVLEAAFEFDSKFIVASDLLRDYIKEKNPNATVIASVIKPINRFQGPDKTENPTTENETEYYNKLLKEYDIVVVRPEYSKEVLVKDPTLIDDLSRIEILINQTCIWDCPKAPEHYKFIEDFRYKTTCKKEDVENFPCIKKDIPIPQQIQEATVHTKEQIETLVKAGVKNIILKNPNNKYMTMDVVYALLYESMFDVTNPYIQNGFFVVTSKGFKEQGDLFGEAVKNCSTIHSIL